MKITLGSQPTLPGEVITSLFGAVVGYGNAFVPRCDGPLDYELPSRLVRSQTSAGKFLDIARSSSRRQTADKLLDAGQDGLLIAREDPVIAAVELDESRIASFSLLLTATRRSLSTPNRRLAKAGTRGNGDLNMDKAKFVLSFICLPSHSI